MTTLRVGLLPFYIELYDKSVPSARSRINRFYRQIAAALKSRGVDTLTAPVCRLKPEFAAAVRAFEKEKVDALVTLHLAYSPSLESAEVLTKTGLPVIVMDTTPTFDYGPDQDPGELMFNHGIHGVQDMCNLLVRNRKPFQIEAGHWQKSDVLKRVAAWVRSARLASAMRRARVGRIGEPFQGMGDFAVPPAVLKRMIGVETVLCPINVIRKLVADIRPKEEDAELAVCRRQFEVKGLDVHTFRRSVRVGLAVRRWIEQEQLTAFTVNFLAVTQASGLPTVPFLEACQAMARGLGYAGEGDVLTAALVGALMAVYPDTTFTEMFCPDWKGNRVFLSHMGEVNPNLLAGKPCLLEYPFVFGDVKNPVKPAGCLREGKAVFVNLAPLPKDHFRLILAPVAMKQTGGKDRFSDSVRGWMKPAWRVSDFLEAYSRAGGTHHAALIYNADLKILSGFGNLMGWETLIIDN